MVRLACGHVVEVRAHLSDGANVIAASCPECRSLEPIAIAALEELSAHAKRLGVAWVASYKGGSARGYPRGNGGREGHAEPTSDGDGASAPGVDAGDPS